MKIGAKDDFENRYMARFEALAAPYGVFVEYARDRAGRDIGLHLTQPAQTGNGKITSPALLWFQMKGIMANTLSKSDYEAAEEVGIDLEVGHLRFWYMNIQPTYLAIYVESVDQFLAIDITKWVADHYGNNILTLEQKTIRVRINKKNALDEQFFRIALEKNLLPVLRKQFSDYDDAHIARFLRDSSVVKWLKDREMKGRGARIIVIKWMSKMRTEVYFEGEGEKGEWEQFRTHWQYSMGDLTTAFPYLSFQPAMTATFNRYSELLEDSDGTPFEVWHETFTVEEAATGEELEDEWDGECLLDLGDGLWSYGEMGGGELIEHQIEISLNEIGEKWANTLQVLVDAEVISVDGQPHMLSVAPWHARDL